MNVFWKTVTTLLFSASFVRGDTIVVPSGNATKSGDGSINPGFNTPIDLEIVFSPKDFSGPVEITGLSFRQDEGTGQGGSFEAVIPRVTLQLSTYHGTYQSFQQSYLQNKGPDEAAVYDAPIDWKATDVIGTQPNPFTYNIPFSRSFVYDPSSGSLLMHYQTTGPYSGGGVVADAQGTPTDGSGGWLAQNHTLGVGFQVLVTRFDVIPVPEPGPLLLTICSLPMFFLIRKKL